MKYTNVPLPAPVVSAIDSIVAEESRGYRSRPDFILHHIRIALENIKIERMNKGGQIGTKEVNFTDRT